ncbi:MAG: transcription elongation factor GreA [Myxococcota bacterium]|nr:transcription elongation factor GreA [Myxococcota bacterium]
MQRSPITPEGHARLSAELKHAKSVERPAVVKQIEEARAHGDLSENAEYDAAKEKQGMLEARIKWLEHLLATAEVIDILEMPKSERVIFGTTVTLVDLDTEDEVAYRIVSDYEADVKEGKISYSSPIGRAVIGKSEGDEVRVETPKGVRNLEIAEVEYK